LVSVDVREATDADLEPVVAVKVRGWADTYGPLVDSEILRPFLDPERHRAQIRRLFLEPSGVLLVAVEREQDMVVGFALTDLAHRPEPLLESLHVLSEHRSQGIGGRLMIDTAMRVEARGYTSMRLTVVESNLAARRFYDRVGGVLAGVEQDLWGSATVPGVIYRWPDVAVLARG
jgi:ribosomal protein S18 acetylase RimI-like enzyme